MNSFLKIRRQLILGWLVAAVTIFTIPYVLISEASRSHYFLLRILWSEALCTLVWFSIGFYVFISTNSKSATKHFGGISPNFFLISVIYAVVSFLFMIFQAYMPPVDLANRVHFAVQIILFAVFFITCIFFVVSCLSESAGEMPVKYWPLTPKALHDMIFSVESIIQDRPSLLFKSHLKQLRETILFSMTESDVLAESAVYQDFCSEIKDFCKMAEAQIEEPAILEENNSELEKAVIKLLSKSKVVSESLVKR